MKLIPTSTNPVTITLYRNYPFDNSYSETALLSRRFTYNGVVVGADSNSFLDLKDGSNHYIFPRTTKTGTYNFAFGNGIVTSLILELNDEEINTNFIKVECSMTHEVYYYFVTEITQKNELTYQVSLELDIFMTYGDKFLEIMKNIPVMTERKHCYRVTPTGNPRCSDLIKPDSNFTGIKANVTESVIDLQPKILDVNGVNLKQYSWCYIILKAVEDTYGYVYNENGVIHPYLVLCFPMVTTKFYNGNTLLCTLNPSTSMKHWGTDERVYKICILPYPPFNNLGSNVITSQTDNELIITMDSLNVHTAQYNEQKNLDIDGVGGTNVHTKFLVNGGSGLHYCCLIEGLGGAIDYQPVDLFSNYINTPRINTSKNYNEWKTDFYPFKDYRLMGFASEPVNFHPELRLNKVYNNTDWTTFYPRTIVTSNPDNTTYFTSMRVQQYDVENKVGLATNFYYSMPTSYTALQHFLNTASAEYNNSKVINSLSAIANIGIGAMGVAKGGEMAKIAGTGAIVSGVIKEIGNITSYTAKMEDLKNTPSNLTTGGSTFTLDYAFALTTGLSMTPFISIYRCEDSIMKCGSDFFYNYGYEVNRDCYFETDLYEETYPISDSRIFTRTLFNYVKLSEDITGKLVGYNITESGIPYAIAKKFGEVFMNGITIWNFFGFTTLQNKVNVDGIYDVFKYFHKCTFNNAEFYNQSY